MYLIIIAALILILFYLRKNSATLNSMLDLIRTIHEKEMRQNDTIEETPDDTKVKKPAKPFSQKAKMYRDGNQPSFMQKYRGYIYQPKIFFKYGWFWDIEDLPSEDIHSYVKKGFLISFMQMLKDNNLNLLDLKIESTYAGYGPHEVYYIVFKILDYEYEEWDKWRSEANIELTLKDGETKKVMMESYFNDLTDYYDSGEYEIIHFFDALKKSYYTFEVTDGIRYVSDFYEAKPSESKYAFSINDLYNHYNKVYTNNNIELFGQKISLLDEWYGKLKEAYDYPSIIDEQWSILPEEDNKVYVLDSYEEYKEKEEELFEKYNNESDENLDHRFICASINFYDAWKLSGREDEQKYIDKAITLWRDLADKNHPYSLLIMGILYFDGKYVLKDIEKSKECLRKAYDYGFREQSVKVWNDFNYQ